MNQDERELENIVNNINSKKINVPPFFEVHITVFSIAMTIMLFTFPEVINGYPIRIYEYMNNIMSQYAWGFSFFIVSMLKSVGLMANINFLRIIGLIGSAIIYILMTICFSLTFPNIMTLMFASVTIFTIISIPFVKHTSIITKD